jgi:hypothetical protein
VHHILAVSRGAFLALGAVLTLARVAAADDVGLKLDYEAPSGCAEASALRATIDRLVARPSTEPVAARVVIFQEGENQFVSRITINGAGERRLDGVSCNEVAQATAVVLALALNPKQASTEEPTAPSAVAAPPTTKAETTPTIVERGTATSSKELEWNLGASITGSAGALPRPDIGFSLGLGVGGTFWETALRGVYWLPQRAHVAADASRGGDFQWWTVSPEICGVPVNGTSRIGLCLGPEIGQMIGDGFGVDVRQQASTLWLAGVAAVEYHFRISRHQRLRADLGLAWHFVGHREFVLGTTLVHEPSPFSGRAGVGWEFVF